MEGIVDERRPPFEDDVVRYYGQYVALAVADTFENAKAAADPVRATYVKDKYNVDTDLKADDEPEEKPTTFETRSACKANAGIRSALLQAHRSSSTRLMLRRSRRTDPIELQATTAIWDGEMLTIYKESQGVFNLRSVLAQMFGLPKENVRVITKFVGSGFAASWPWTHCPLHGRGGATSWVSRSSSFLSRKMIFQYTRPRLGDGCASAGERKEARSHSITITSTTSQPRQLSRRLRRGDGLSATACRSTCLTSGAPGVTSAKLLHALSRRRAGTLRNRKKNELAFQLKMDPVRFRVVNKPKINSHF